MNKKVNNETTLFNLYKMSIFQQLSEDFIREFQDDVDWYNISIYQQL